MADTIKTNLGPVTAYADAKAHGYTGTREEFGQLLANAGLNLKAAETAKADAEAAKQAAETAQQAAAENQKNAGTQAANAKASADTAAEQAAVAKESAANAANSATAAQESETNAGLSATAAANAEAAAKQAQNTAETAKADAETAKASAGNSADAAANSAADAKKTLESIPADYSTLSGKVDENASEISELKEDLTHYGIIKDMSIVWNNGYYGYNGALNTDQGYYSEKILMFPNDKIIFSGRGYLDKIAIISEWNGDKAITIPLVISEKDKSKYEYIADKYLEIILSSVDKGNAVIVRNSDNFKKEEITIEQGYYISVNAQPNSDDACYISNIIHLNSGDTICFKEKGYQDKVAVLTQVDYTDGGFIPLLISNGKLSCYCYKADESVDVVVAGYVAEKDIYISRAKENNKYDPDYTKLMKKVGVVGDSLISGVMYDGDTGKNCWDYSWIGNIFKPLGNEVFYFSHGGYGVKTWFDNNYDKKLTDAEMCDTYFINFGTNDIWRKEYPLGWSSDGAGSNSFCGWYKKLIEFIHSYNPNAKIFCMGLYDTSSDALKYNIQIFETARLYDYCYFCNTLVATTVHTNISNDNLISNKHPTALGYLIIGDDFKRFINNIVSANKVSFKLSGFYNYSG